MRIARLFVPAALVLAIAACGGEPGASELEEAKKLQAENHRPEAIQAYEQIVKEFPGTKAAQDAEVALDQIRCEDARVKVTEAWTAVQAEAGNTEGVTQVDPATVQAKVDAYTAAQTAATGCTPESTDAACTEKLTAQQQAADALAIVYVDACKGQAQQAARAAVGTAAATATGGGEAPALDVVVRDAATGAAQTCIAGLTNAPQSPNLTAEGIGQAVTDELLASPAFGAVKTATDEAATACPAQGGAEAAPAEQAGEGEARAEGE